MEHCCYQDIKTQPEALSAAIAAVDAAYPQLEEILAEKPTELIFVACGSPYYLGLSNAALWRERAGIAASAIPASEVMLFGESALPKEGRPLLLTASRSGETTETIEAVKAFEARFPGRSVLIGCKESSTLGDLVAAEVIVPEGYDDVIPQTRSFTTMYLAAQYLTARATGDGKLAEALRRVPESLPAVLESAEDVLREFARGDWNSAVFLGGGPLYGIATEGGLKVTEMALERISVYHTLEVRHGPRSVIDEETLVVSLASRRGIEQERGVLSDLSRQTPRLLELTSPPARPSEDGLAWTSLATGSAPEVPEHALGLLYIPLLQLLAYHRALHNGVDPDESKNLTSYVELPGSG